MSSSRLVHSSSSSTTCLRLRLGAVGSTTVLTAVPAIAAGYAPSAHCERGAKHPQQLCSPAQRRWCSPRGRVWLAAMVKTRSMARREARRSHSAEAPALLADDALMGLERATSQPGAAVVEGGDLQCRPAMDPRAALPASPPDGQVPPCAPAARPPALQCGSRASMCWPEGPPGQLAGRLLTAGAPAAASAGGTSLRRCSASCRGAGRSGRCPAQRGGSTTRPLPA